MRYVLIFLIFRPIGYFAAEGLLHKCPPPSNCTTVQFDDNPHLYLMECP